jgi:hypothetical protein
MKFTVRGLLCAYLSLTCTGAAQEPSAPVAAARSASAAAQNSPQSLHERYRLLEIAPFEVMEGTDFPPEYISLLQTEILDEMKKSKQFDEVLLQDKEGQPPESGSLRLSGTVEYFDAGSRGKRYIGLGLGVGHLQARVVLRDRTTGTTVVVQEISANLAGGLFGGKSETITHEFAKRLADSCKVLLARSVPAQFGSPAEADSVSAPVPAESKTVTIRHDDLNGCQAELNTLGSAGFHIVGFFSKGTKAADATLTKSFRSSQAYAFKILHVLWLNNLQKDMNNAAKDGFRYVPNTLAQMKGTTVFAIMEQSSEIQAARYEYRVKSAMKISNSQKDIARAERENFTLAGALDVGGIHILLLERAVSVSPH